jgi:DNA-binding CsgD family transcriptional regulator
VAIVAADADLRARFVQLVHLAGHQIVETPENAQVILCDGQSSPLGMFSVAVGYSNHNHAGQLPPNATAEQIDAALRAVAAGLTIRHPQYRSAEFEELADRAASELLTPRELDVLNAISDGMSNKAAARKLGISLHTVKFHVESLFRKLGVRTRAEAVARGLERRSTETIEL